MGEDMLTNQSFSSGGEDVSTGGENIEAVASDSTEETQVETSEETSNTEESTEQSVAEETTSVEAENIVEETTEKTQEDSQAETQVEGESLTTEGPKPTRASRRIKKLLAEKMALEEQAAVRTKEMTNSQLKPNAEGEVEMTPDQLSSFISEQVQGTLSAEREQQLTAQKAEAWDDDIKELMDSNPELNPDSGTFNQNLSDALVDLIRASNVDDGGQPVVRKLPSEVFATISSTINAAKSTGQIEASKNLKKKTQEAAVQNAASTEPEAAKYSDADLATMQHADPRKYADLIENNII